MLNFHEADRRLREAFPSFDIGRIDPRVAHNAQEQYNAIVRSLVQFSVRYLDTAAHQGKAVHSLPPGRASNRARQ